MPSSYSAKRARLSLGARRDPVVMPGDGSAIRERETPLKRVGGSQTLFQGPAVRSTPSESTWKDLQAWEPVDSQDFALDPSGRDWYDKALDQDVMDEPRRPVILKKKYVRSRVAVSLNNLFYRISFKLVVETSPCCLERNLSAALPRGANAIGGSG